MPMLDSYLFFNGTCGNAMRFYEKTIGGRIAAMMTYAESPDPSQHAADAKDRIMHSHMIIGDRNLMASDVPPGYPAPPSAGFALALTYPTTEEAKKVFDGLAAGGNVTMPMSKTFWIELFGMVTDQFGVPWMVSGGQPAKAP